MGTNSMRAVFKHSEIMAEKSRGRDNDRKKNNKNFHDNYSVTIYNQSHQK
jgi:hypothetical protein